MTEEEFKTATPEEIAAEMERCKDPYYVYHTYWRNADGSLPRQYTREDWDSMMAFLEKQKANRFRNYRVAKSPNRLKEAMSLLPEFIRPKTT